jgi:hypothetical protein
MSVLCNHKKLEIGKMYYHYPYGQKNFKTKVKNNVDALVGKLKKSNNQTVYIKVSDLFLDKNKTRIVMMYLGREGDLANFKFISNNVIYYYLSEQELINCGDEFEEIE